MRHAGRFWARTKCSRSHNALTLPVWSSRGGQRSGQVRLAIPWSHTWGANARPALLILHRSGRGAIIKRQARRAARATVSPQRPNPSRTGQPVLPLSIFAANSQCVLNVGRRIVCRERRDDRHPGGHSLAVRSCPHESRRDVGPLATPPMPCWPPRGGVVTASSSGVAANANWARYPLRLCPRKTSRALSRLPGDCRHDRADGG